MQNRLPMKEVFTKVLPYCPPVKEWSADGLLLIPLLFETDASSPNEYFSKLTLEQQEKIKISLEMFRTYLLELLNTKTYPSDDYRNIYNALLLLAQYFPTNAMNKKHELICPLSSQGLNEKNTFILASGMWVLKSGENSIIDYYEKDKKNNAINNASTRSGFLEEDLTRIKELSPDQNHFAEDKKGLSLTGEGAMIGMSMAVAVGIAAVVFALLMPFSLTGALAVALVSGLILPSVGAVIGAVIGAVVENAVDSPKRNKKYPPTVHIATSHQPEVDSSSTKGYMQLPIAHPTKKVNSPFPNKSNGQGSATITYGNPSGGLGLYDPRRGATSPSAPNEESLKNEQSKANKLSDKKK